MKRILAALTAIMICIAASAQADTAVYIVNIYPGPDIYELEGHTAIMVETPNEGLVAYNYGVFDFDAPNFVYRFVKGETDYMAAAQNGNYFLAAYNSQQRRMVAHELNLDSSQKARLIDALKTNVLPDNRVYRYNYVKDNCATRPLRVVENVIGEKIDLAPAPIEANSGIEITFRNIMRHYHRNYPWYQFGIDLALGSGIDYPLTRREMAFAPAELDGMLAHATVGGKRLVSRSTAINEFAPDSAIEGPTPWYVTPMAVALLVLAVAIILTVRDVRRRRVTRWFDAVYFGVLGLTGLLLTFLIFVSVHEATSPNWLYLWLNPLCLVPTIFIYIKKARNFVLCYQKLNFALLLAFCIAWPFTGQSGNVAFIPFLLADMIRAASYIYIVSHNK